MRENSTDSVLLAHYATKGGKYEVRAYRCIASNGRVYYAVDQLTNGCVTAGATNLEEGSLGLELARIIYLAARYSKINFRPIKEWPEATRLLTPQEV